MNTVSPPRETSYQLVVGAKDGQRVDSRLLEEQVQELVARGQRRIKVKAFGQHGIGGRLWRAGNEPVDVLVEGHAGQRLGSLGFPNTRIVLRGPASDDVGWLNAGAHIVVHGHAANGVANGMAQGRIYIAGSIGARGMTMTKNNPRFSPPELWVLGSAGDYFGEFMAGGVAVVCGVDPQNPDNILGYRPCVGMVGGKVFFRGPIKDFSRADAKLEEEIGDADWQWLCDHLAYFLADIERPDLAGVLTRRIEWRMLRALSPHERSGRRLRPVSAFRKEVWEAELGRGGLVGDLTDIDRSPIPLIVSGDLRRWVPVWENGRYAAPCEANCPTGIPVQERWALVRQGKIDEAVELALAYTPFPATVCGYLCPNLCMAACTKHSALMAPVDVSQLGRASIAARLPDMPPADNHRIAVIGGGPAGLSVAWQLRRSGHRPVVLDTTERLGGKMTAAIPESRIPPEVLDAELERLRQAIDHQRLEKPLSPAAVEQMKKDYDFIVVAVGAERPRRLPVPGAERMITALDFLARAKAGSIQPGRRVIIVGAGNVGCDVATEAHRLGAEEITLIDVQEPASFGKERRAAEAVGARFRWPVFTREITEDGLVTREGELLAADTVVVAIGDSPDLSFLPASVAVERGFVQVDEHFQTSDPKIFAIGDAVRPGLITDAIGAGRRAAAAIDAILAGRRPEGAARPMIDKERIALAYFDPRIVVYEDVNQCADQCASCGTCRDCGICVAVCPQAAIERVAEADGGFRYQAAAERCIGCGFCAGACPCGVWALVPNTPLG
jgi:NADPH-dependent glutamate synthase beta subunit-like oxidoreductase/glutamate synthase domain-containing protein 3/NAD-dependent dihydropyrimidine dehydrogenase PreA subunit